MEDMPIAKLEFNAVSKRLGQQDVLRDLSLRVPAWGGMALVGESGSGKSTLLSLALGLIEPDSGSINLFDEPLTPTNVRTQRQRIGYALQETGLFPHLSVLDNLCLQGRLLGHESEQLQTRARLLAEQMHLDPDMLKRYPIELSGGQQQRAGICRAMLLEPELLLLDEPFSGLDVVTRNDIYDHFVALANARRCSFLLVTHDLNEAQRLCATVAVLRDGRIVDHGPSERVINDPRHDYVARLVAAQRLHIAHG
ncbi:MAG: ATP-binding cassette domain-containing protein [Pseudomonadota bacterium]